MRKTFIRGKARTLFVNALVPDMGAYVERAIPTLNGMSSR